VSVLLPVLIFLIFAAVIGLFAYQFYAKKKRKEEFATLAATQGFNYAPDDPLALLNTGLPLLSLGDDRGIENTMWGDFRGLQVEAADYWYYTESTDSKGHTSRSYRRYSIAITTVDAYLPDLTIQPENVLTRLADHVGLHDIDFESGEFNDRFQVKAAHRKFAFDFIDARMMKWLLSIDARYGIQTRATKLMVFSKQLAPADAFLLVGTMKELVDRIPALVWEDYGTPHAGEAEVSGS
jgi:hypothetical protein